MNKEISKPHALLINLKHAAIWHRSHCNESCNVSLGMIKNAAEYLIDYIPKVEQAEAIKLLNDFPKY